MISGEKILGVAWRFKGTPTLEEYKAFMAKEPVLAMIFPDGHRENIRLELIPHSPFPDDDFYVFPWLIRLDDISRWEAPEEVGKLRLSIHGKGFRWLDREAFVMPNHQSAGKMIMLNAQEWDRFRALRDKPFTQVTAHDLVWLQDVIERLIAYGTKMDALFNDRDAYARKLQERLAAHQTADR